jgi:hypothetical protein
MNMEWIQIFRNEELTGFSNGNELKVVRSNGQIIVGKPKKIQMPPKGHKDYFFLKTYLTLGYVSSLGKDSESIFLTEEEDKKWQNFLNISEQSTKIRKSLDEDNRMRVLLQAESLDRINARKKRDQIVKRLDSRFSHASAQTLWCELIVLENNLASIDYVDTSELVYLLQTINEAIDIKASFSISLQVDQKSWSLYFWQGRVIWATGLNLDVWHRLAREQVNMLDDPSDFYGFNAALPIFIEGELSEAELDLLFTKTFGIDKAVEGLLGSIVTNILVDIIQSVRFAKKRKEGVISYSTKKIYSSSATIGQDYAPLIGAALAQWSEWMDAGVEDLSPYDYVSKNYDSSIDASRIYGLAKLGGGDGGESVSSLTVDGSSGANLAMTIMELVKVGAVYVSSGKLLSSTTSTTSTTSTIAQTSQAKVCVMHRSPEVFDHYQRLLFALDYCIIGPQNPDDALPFLIRQTEKPSLILIDSDERILLNFLKSTPLGDDIPVVLISDNRFLPSWLTKRKIGSAPKQSELQALINRMVN